MSYRVKPDSCIRVMSFDPSTTNLGISVFDVNVMVRKPFELIYSNTIYGEKVIEHVNPQFDDRAGTGVAARSYGLMRSVIKLVNIYEPDTAICEDNFLGVSPKTFKQLIQAVAQIREAVNSVDGLHLSYVPPREAKDIVGANFSATQKEDVHKGILKYRWLKSKGIDLNLLDEHSVDSVAIGLFRCEQIAKDYGVWFDNKGVPPNTGITK